MSDFLTSYKTARTIQGLFAIFTLLNTYLAVMHLHRHDWFGLAVDLSLLAAILWVMHGMRKTLIVRKELDAKIDEMFRKHGIRR